MGKRKIIKCETCLFWSCGTKTRNQLVVKSVHSSGSLNSFFSVFVILMWIKEGALKNV